MLYRQGNQKIEVIVRKDSGISSPAGTKGASAHKAANTQSDSTQLGPDIDKPKTEAGVRQTSLGKFIAAGVVQFAKQAAFTGFDYYISGIGMRTGDQALQAQIGRKIEIVKDVVSVGSSLYIGAKIGSSLGPLGAVVGALAGTASSAISIGVRQAERERSYNYEIFKENNSIQYQKTRAGLNMTNGRLR